MRIFIFFFLLSFVSTSCKKTQESVSKEFMQSARGDADEIIIVSDSSDWAGDIGSALRSIFRSPIQGLPQDEAPFKVNKASPLKLNSVLKSAVNMVFVMTLDNPSRESKVIRNYFTDESLKEISRDTSRFMLVRKDEFARGQTVLYFFSKEGEILAEQLRQNEERIRQYFENQVKQKVASSLLKSREPQIEKVLQEDHNIQIRVPFGWELAKNKDNFVWMRLLDVDQEQNVFLYYQQYNDASVFENVLDLRDKITETYLRDSEKRELYITRQDRPDLRTAFFDQTTFKGMYAMELRGLWKISDNSAGGPYVSYTFVDEDTQTLYYLEGYVYAPGGKKKNLVREVEAIMSTFKLIEEENQ